MYIVVLILIGYFLGSIPFAYLISRIKGVNILKEGTGIPGAANVYRLVGPKYGAMVLLVDILILNITYSNNSRLFSHSF